MCAWEFEGYPSQITQRVPIRKRGGFFLPAKTDAFSLASQLYSAVDAKQETHTETERTTFTLTLVSLAF